MSVQIAKSSDGGEGGTYTSSDCSDGEQQDESSSSKQSTEETLASFREQWQKELKISPSKQKKKVNENATDSKLHEEDFEERAKNLFLKGVDLEKSGKLYEAIQYYRHAVQIVPDIEFKICHLSKQNPRESQYSESSEEEQQEVAHESDTSESDVDEDFESGELLSRIEKKLSKKSSIFAPQAVQRATHISSLPIEIILYIMRWIVSAELDLRSLEMCALTCRGLYSCARDPEIWRLACFRVWGRNCGTLSTYLSWRQMFIERPRLLFSGCYISKTTYFRHGENSFQDQFYRPWHLIAYFRYLRFFPEGTVLMLTSSDEPAQSVGQLKYRNVRPPVLHGYYRLKDDKVTLIVQRQDNKVPSGIKKNKRRDNMHELAEQTFHMELQIKSYGKRRHIQLQWIYYSVFTRTRKGDESTCNFDLVTNRFPPFWFSRVKSYTSESDSLLQ